MPYIDTPWEADDIRDRPNAREEFFKVFEEALLKSNKPYVLVKGTYEERLKFCISQIENLLK